MCVFAFVWRVTPSISRALEKVTLLESSLHLGLPCPWILWGFFLLLLLEAKTKWDDIYYICLTADRLVLTHPPHKLMHGAFVVSLLVTFKLSKKNKNKNKGSGSCEYMRLHMQPCIMASQQRPDYGRSAVT